MNKKRVEVRTRRKKVIKTYAFIDASNIIYGARAEGWFIDQKKLYQYLKQKFSVSKVFFYYVRLTHKLLSEPCLPAGKVVEDKPFDSA